MNELSTWEFFSYEVLHFLSPYFEKFKPLEKVVRLEYPTPICPSPPFTNC